MRTIAAAPLAARGLTGSGTKLDLVRVHSAPLPAMALPGILSTKPHRVAGLAFADAVLYAMHLQDPDAEWSVEWWYVYNGFACITIWTLIKLLLEHGFNP